MHPDELEVALKAILREFKVEPLGISALAQKNILNLDEAGIYVAHQSLTDLDGRKWVKRRCDLWRSSCGKEGIAHSRQGDQIFIERKDLEAYLMANKNPEKAKSNRKSKF